MKKRRYILVEFSKAGAVMLDKRARGLIRGALANMSAAWDGKQPAELFQARLSLDGNKAIYEVTYDDAVKPGAALGLVAASMGVKAEVLAALVGHTIFAEDKSADASAELALKYLAEHAKEWEAAIHV